MTPTYGPAGSGGPADSLPGPAVPGVVLLGRVRDAGAGDVWAGSLADTGAECTVRRIRLPPDTAIREAAMGEARSLVTLAHPHLVSIIDVIAIRDGIAILAESVPGAVSMARLLGVRNRLDPGEVVTLGLPVAQALVAAHAVGFVHGQLDFADILLEPNGRPLLAGVGLANLAGAAATPAVDVGDLAGLLLTAMPHSTGPDAAAVAVAVAPALVDDPARRPTADELAMALARSCNPAPIRLMSDAVTPLPLPPPPSGTDGAADDGAERGQRFASLRAGRAGRGPRVVPGGHISPPRVAEDPPPDARAGTARGGDPVPRLPGVRAHPGTARGAVAPTARRGAVAPMARQGRGGGRGRTAIMVAVIGVLALLLAGGLLAARGAGPRHPDQPAADAATSVDTASPPSAVVSSAAVEPSSWREVLVRLDEARSRAFARADEAALTEADAAGSTAHARDVALMREMVARGARATGLRQEILALVVQDSGSEKVVLRITYRLPPYSYVDDTGKVLALQPGYERERSDVTLVRTERGWRIATAVGVTAK